VATTRVRVRISLPRRGAGASVSGMNVARYIDPLGLAPRAAGAGRRLVRSTRSVAGDGAIAALELVIRSELAARGVRALVQGPLGDEAAKAAIRSGLVERVADEILAAGVVERVADRALATPLPQHVADRLLAEGVAEQVAERVLEGPELERLVAAVLESPGMIRVVEQVLDSRLVDESVARVLASEELWLLVDEIVRSPAVTAAITQQGAGFAEQVVDAVGERSRRADAWLERATRRVLHRAPPAATPAGPTGP
jgi:hypothetical protein